jgi:dihydrofolate synthase/folylpolyglutamate synthase
MLNTKDLIASLASIQSNIDVWYFAPLQQEKSITYQNLENACDVLGIEQYQIFSNLDLAYSAATECASLSDRIAIFGSFHTVSELLR